MDRLHTPWPALLATHSSTRPGRRAHASESAYADVLQFSKGPTRVHAGPRGSNQGVHAGPRGPDHAGPRGPRGSTRVQPRGPRRVQGVHAGSTPGPRRVRADPEFGQLEGPTGSTPGSARTRPPPAQCGRVHRVHPHPATPGGSTPGPHPPGPRLHADPEFGRVCEKEGRRPCATA